MKKQIVSKLHLNKETLRHLSERDLQGAVGGATYACSPTGLSYCFQCPTESCITGDSCLTPTWAANCC
ncbi:MAG TPA: class I lanthipeptide [Thermoanaerobaculia bacterium]|nr:class I lanthipeptide [Thermoanaerobaculia bacterium]